MTAEEKRIEKLKKFDILDTPPDGTYEHIVRLAANLLNVPIALVSLVDTDRIWFKSAFGLDVQEIPKEAGLCASAILSDEFYMVEDALKDPRTLANSLVTGEFGLRFYAAVPLTTSDGYNLGTLCVLDKQPRTLSKKEQGILEDLAHIVVEQMELRLMARLAINSQNKMAYLITHDVRAAVSNISSLVDIVQEKLDAKKEVAKFFQMINLSIQKSMKAIDGFLNYARSISKDITYNFEYFDFAELVEKVVATNEVLANKKGQKFDLSIEYGLTVKGDWTSLSEMVDNLLSNAIKYSPPGKSIYITATGEVGNIMLEVRDEGLGMSPDDIDHAFKRFGKLSAKPTGDEISTGLGLWIVKEIAERHRGTVKVNSEGKDKGAAFIVRLPVYQ